jgi:cytochrome c5
MRAALAALLALLPWAVPAAEQPVALKDGAGRAAVEQNCGACHSLDYIGINAPFMTPQVWTAEVNKMIDAFGAPVPPEDAKAIIDYLVRNYGKPG